MNTHPNSATFIAVFITLSTSAAADDRAAFTYQGQLMEAGIPASGNYDFRFGLFDAPKDGSQIGREVVLDAVRVSGGLFTVVLNAADEFGEIAFNGSNRWLQVYVDGNALLPRQGLTAAPYAVFSQNTRGLRVDEGGNVGVLGAISAGGLSVLGCTSNVGSCPGTGAETSENTSPAWWSAGVYGKALQGSANAFGVRGRSEMNGTGVVGECSSTDTVNDIFPNCAGVLGFTDSAFGTGVLGVAIGSSGSTGVSHGGSFHNDSTDADDVGALGTCAGGVGVSGSSTSGIGGKFAGFTYGVHATATGPAATGLFASSINGIGVHGAGADDGVFGTGFNGVRGESAFGNGNGVVGIANIGTSAWGVSGASTQGQGVVGRAGPGPLPGGGFPAETGVVGYSNGTSGIGVFGQVTSPTGLAYGVYGTTNSPSGFGGYFENTAGTYAGHFAGNVCVDGNLYVTGTFSGPGGTCPSDARFKRNIAPLSGALATVAMLRGVSFDWNWEQFPKRRFPHRRQIGVIAQEVREVLPELVTLGSDGYLSVDYGRLTPVLIEALHELRAENNRQLAERDAQMAQLRRDLARKDAGIESLRADGVAQAERIDDLLHRMERFELALRSAEVPGSREACKVPAEVPGAATVAHHPPTHP